MTTQTFATSSDVEDRWRELSATERDLADTLAQDASRRIRRRWKTVDARIAAGTLDPDDVRMVVAGVVKRAMLNSAAEGVSTMTDSGGPFSKSVTYVNPTANLFFTKEDAQVLAPNNRRVRSITLTTSNY
jgi:hypothetical protein